MPQTATNVVELKKSASVTPMMAQYLAIKEEHKDYMLFYRMGDFYELFFEDAIIAAEALDIALTKRGKHESQDIPMCGVPAHSHESYLQRLIKKGFKVAICDQLEDPKEAKKRGSKAVVKREVTRIITPGTLTEESLLEAKAANYLAALAQAEGQLALAWVDISTGKFAVSTTSDSNFISDIARLNPKELLISQKLYEDPKLYESLSEWKSTLTPHVDSFFDSGKGERKLKDFYEVATLQSFGDFNRAELGACGALLEYIELTQKGQMPRLLAPQQFATQQVMAIDAATRKSLELTHTLSGSYKGSLLHTIDRTVTAAGARLLATHLNEPLLDVDSINRRLDRVCFFIDNSNIRDEIRTSLKQTPDLERAMSRLCLNRGGPRDLLMVREGLKQSLTIAGILEFTHQGELPDCISTLLKQLGNHDRLIQKLSNALEDEVGFHARDGGFIREGYHAKLDAMRNARAEGEHLKQELQEQYRQETGVDSLKVSENNVIGMFIELTAKNASKAPEYFIHRQTLAGVVRYTTTELREIENRIIHAKEHSLSLELELFAELVVEVTGQVNDILETAQALAQLDVASGLALLASEQNYNRPEIEDSQLFDIEGGRHPVVEATLKEEFIANNCKLEEDAFMWLITGPNMAGKSTFLRQNALIAVLAQMGSYVPATSAKIGLVDRLFSRVGASDDLARGHSTFMVEMVETATILNQATDRSLVILDEIGRGTATFDGLSIAWAVVEYLHQKNKARTLFATHYHELTTLVATLPALTCYTMKVKEWNDDVIFMHEVIPGTADRSYGIHVAKIAGLPKPVIKRAEEVLKTIQEEEGSSAVNKLVEELPLFALAESDASDYKAAPELDTIITLLEEIEIDNLSPRQALELLYELKEKLPHDAD